MKIFFYVFKEITLSQHFLEKFNTIEKTLNLKYKSENDVLSLGKQAQFLKCTLNNNYKTNLYTILNMKCISDIFKLMNCEHNTFNKSEIKYKYLMPCYGFIKLLTL
ncbi:hypothetical protein PVBG_05047 [Plasmodium vivax Brazil I]|uniref:Uncharacterized protein n=1 Tax=Plasmodium vivax (strain Brazil I) TaxID=1033975 RepID=A0A0J9SXJ6_PLAV1|nr:hypothetical protein PVBG_05047 [Plasmodium vivax Brazil I]